MSDPAPLRVRGLTAYPASVASARVRVVQHIPFLERQGVALRHQPSLSDREYALLSSGASPLSKALALARGTVRAAVSTRPGDALLLVQRLVLLAPFPGVDPPRRIDVYDIDDALLIGSPSSANARYAWVKREAKRARAAIQRARLVVVANETLAAQARELNHRVEVVPSCVDPSAQDVRRHDDRGQVTIGWIGSRTTAAYLAPVLPVLARLHARGLPLRLVVIGGDTGLRESWVEHRQWDLGRQSEDLAGLDIGLMPLPDTPWARGKAGYKLLQYFAAGVPAVGSPVGVNASLLDGRRGIPAIDDGGWERALTELATDAAGRGQRGALAREFVEREYSFERWSPELAAMLRSLA